MKRSTIGWSVALGVVVTALVVLVVYAASVTIDSFDEGLQELKVTPGPTPPVPEYNYVDTSAALGGQRDIVLYSLGGGQVNAQVDAQNNNRFDFASFPGATGAVSVTWDGVDNNAVNIATSGLGGVDLTGGGTQDGFRFRIVNADKSSGLLMAVYSSTNRYTHVISLPGGIESGHTVDVFFPFASFGLAGGTADTNWRKHAGAIVMVITGTADADVAIDLLNTFSGREYGDLPTSAQGCTNPGNACYSTAVLEAYHVPQGMRLGYSVDVESNYQATYAATGDDAVSGLDVDDEDGVVVRIKQSLPECKWQSGFHGCVQVTMRGCSSSNPCLVVGWIDFNRDGDFADPGEDVVADVQVGDVTLLNQQFSLPTSYVENRNYYARFRVCPCLGTDCATSECLNPTGNATNGEVEDYWWPLGPTAIELRSLTARALPRWTAAAGAGALALAALGGLAVARRRRAAR